MDKLSALAMSAVISTSLLVPLTTYAYLTPDQVFGGSSGVAGNNLPPPPTQREGEDVIAVQQQQAADQRAAAQQALTPVDAPPVDTYVPPPAPVENKGLFDQNAQYELRKQRMEEQKAAAPTIIIGGDAAVTDANGNVLHSGAPRVSTTGPASVLAGIAMILAACCTLAYSRYRTRSLLVPA